jgi:hypothetical protein
MMEWSTLSYATWAATALVVATLAGILLLISAFTNAPAASGRSSDHGASFAVRCDFSHRLSEDPIAHFGHEEESGMAHKHDFFGNTSTYHSSTYNKLRAADTTCTRPEDKAAYWLPTVKWGGTEVDSNRAVYYYRAGGKNHKTVKPFPANLQVIARKAGATTASWACASSSPTAGTGAAATAWTTAPIWPTAEP